MRNICSTGLVAFMAVVLSAPNVAAHNPAKYTNVPFVVAANCPNDSSTSSANWVNLNHSTVLQVNTNNEAVVGSEIFTSVPSSNSTPSPSSGTIPVGTYSFSVSGATSAISNINAFYISSTGDFNDIDMTIVNGVASVTIPTPSSGSLVSVQFAVQTSSSSNITVFLSNFPRK